jgi:tetratricopeptide (TPR) repeat protein
MSPSEPDSGDAADVLAADWHRLRAALETDEAGRLILADLAADRSGAEPALAQWLTGHEHRTQAPIAQVFGGSIGQLVIIARAEAVNYYGQLAHPPRPWQLPGPPDDFTDRVPETEELDQMLAAPGRTATVISICGQPAVGKTSLALMTADRLRDRYPDGQLYADLGLDGDDPESVSRTLDAFLRDLGAPSDLIPDDLAGRERLYRSYTAERRLLVLLDNVWTEGQARPLIPTGSGCLLLATSRRRLLALDRGHRIWLEVFSPEHAMELMTRIAGEAVIGSDLTHARLIAGLCGYLPLALRIVAVRLSVPPKPSLAWMARRLLDEQRRLEELNIGDRGVRSAYMISYERLGDRASLLFRLLGLVDIPTIAPWTAAALLHVPEAQGEAALQELSDNALLEPIAEDSAGQLRYRSPDLLRVFAREQADQDHDRERLARGVRHLIESACGLTVVHSLQLFPDSYLRALADQQLDALATTARASETAECDSQAWLTEEQPVLFRLAARARTEGYEDLLWRFLLALQDYCEFYGYLAVWEELGELAIGSLQLETDPVGFGYASRSLGIAQTISGAPAQAVLHLDRARRSGEALGDQMLVATSLRAAAESYGQLGDLDRAMADLETAEALFSQLGKPVWQAWTMWSRAALLNRQPREAARELTQTMRLFEDLGDSRGIAVTLRSLGLNWLRIGDQAQAQRCFEQCLVLFRATSDRAGEALTMDSLGRLYLESGRPEEGLRLLEASAPFISRLGHHEGMI